jgi:hypothetical protein
LNSFLSLKFSLRSVNPGASPGFSSVISPGFSGFAVGDPGACSEFPNSSSSAFVAPPIVATTTDCFLKVSIFLLKSDLFSLVSGAF